MGSMVWFELRIPQERNSKMKGISISLLAVMKFVPVVGLGWDTMAYPSKL